MNSNLTIFFVAALICGLGQVASAQTANNEVESEAEIDEIVVEGRRFRDTADRTSSKIEVPLQENPQAISIVGSDFIEATGIQKFNEALKYVAGVDGGNRVQAGRVRANSRGFALDTTSGIKINGSNIQARGDLDITAIERIEFVKGANSIAYGQTRPGGFINLITKSPHGENSSRIELGAGSDTRWYGGFDVNRVLNDEGTARLRLTGAWEQSKFWESFSNNEREAVQAFFEYDLSDATTLSLDLIYNDYTQLSHWGFALLENQELPDVPLDFTFTYPWASVTYGLRHVWGEIQHNFDNGWTLTFIGYAQDRPSDSSTATPLGIVDENGDVDMLYTHSENTHTTIAGGEVRFGGGFEMFGLEQDFMATLEQYTRDQTSFAFEIFPFSVFNYNNPDYFSVPEPDTSTSNLVIGSDQEIFSASFQGIFRPLPALDIHFGVRFDDISENSLNSLALDRDTLEQNETTYRGALVFRPFDTLNLYYSYSEAFLPQSGIQCDGSIVPNEIGDQNELGAKFDLFDGNVLLTASVYEIQLSNILEFVQCPGETSINSVEPVGSDKSEGFEIELIGSITDTWNVILSYSDLDAFRAESVSDPDSVGAPLANIPSTTASVYTTYDFEEGFIQGLSVGLGVSYVSERPITVPALNDFPEYTVVDASVSYRTGGMEIRLSGSNLTNEEIWDSQFDLDNIGIYRHPPRRVLLDFIYDF